MPKIKYTGRQAWLERVQNYVQWKEHVQTCAVDALKAHSATLGHEAEQRVATGLKPLATGKNRLTMHIHIYWRGEHRADSENVFGSIADAIFENDKYLTGSFDYTTLPKTEQPRVSIIIKPYA